MRKPTSRRATLPMLIALVLGLTVVMAAPDAWGYEFTRVLRRGSHGRDVRALEVRIAGWFPRPVQKRLKIDRRFGPRTRRAVTAFQRHYSLAVDGVAGPQTFGKIASL
ncbi:MAG: peptidoglycan-binding domain-containing protein [Actinomycetota bacterium]